MKNNHIIELSEVSVEKKSLQNQEIGIENNGQAIRGVTIGILASIVCYAIVFITMLMLSGCTFSAHVEWIEEEEEEDVMQWDRLTENDRSRIDELNQKIRYGRN